jgi:phosphonoacetaldehyde hydrolase
MTYPIKAIIFDWAGTMVDFGCMAPVEALIDAWAAPNATMSRQSWKVPRSRPPGPA